MTRFILGSASGCPTCGWNRNSHLNRDLALHRPTPKTRIDKALATCIQESSLNHFQIKQNEQDQAFASERQSIESHFNTQLQSLQAENSQFKDALQKMQAEANGQLNALEKTLSNKLDLQEASTQALKQTINQNQSQLGDLLIQLGQQLKQGHNE